MSLIPAFQIGLWNAWIFILPFLLINYGLASLIAKDSALFIWPQYNKKEKNFLTIAVVNFATTPADKPVTKGVFCISRNPMYVGWFLIYIGIGIACASWIFLLIAMVFIIL